jgi:hypothetical protein
LLDKLLTRLKSEKVAHALKDVQEPGKGTSFEFGRAHGKQVAFDLVEQWIEEILEAEEDDGNE